MRTELITEADVEGILGGPFDKVTMHRCHRAALGIVKSGRLPGSRVARGQCTGVLGQHSWVTLGDPYDPDETIIDVSWWSYKPDTEKIYIGSIGEGWHLPHGYGSIWDWGKPESGGLDPIDLTPSFQLSSAAKAFLDLLGPLDRQGWNVLAHAPVLDWPAGEIFAAMADTAPLSTLVPIDILGMTTDRNPGGLYLPG